MNNLKVATLALLVFMSICYKPSYAQSVGSTDGVFNVSDLGAANYTIPIKVPDGIGGMQPQLAITYSSQGGDGTMGVGWSVSGMSAIVRTSNTIYNDKMVKSPDLSLNDKFSLDGNRLIGVNGNYGTANSTYHTEMESFKEIKAIGTLGNGPLSFIVTDQNGLKYEYGDNNFSRYILPGHVEPLMWLLRRVTDLNGNYISYNYFLSEGRQPSFAYIEYSGNNGTLLSPKSFVTFQYEENTYDPSFSYISGGKTKITQRLKKVYSQQLGLDGYQKRYREYNCDYANDFYSHLVKITESGVDLAETFRPTEFVYGKTAVGNEVSEKIVLQQLANSQSAPQRCIGDFNNDGFSDVINYSTLNGGYFKLFLHNATGGFDLVQNGTLENGFSGSYNENLIKFEQSSLIGFDYNGDGRSDFATYQNNVPQPSIYQQKYWVYLSNGNSLSSIGPIVLHDNPNATNQTIFGHTMPFTGDFDGDGKTEILLLSTLKPTGSQQPGTNYLIGENYNTYTTTLGYPAYKAKSIGNGFGFDASYVLSNESKILVIDYDGDGKNEILSLWHDNATNVNHAQIFRLNITFDLNNKPVIGNPAFLPVNEGNFPGLENTTYLGDFNGDKITDVLTELPGSFIWFIGYGKGDGTFEVTIAPALVNSNNATRPIICADFNGDGKDDIYDYNPAISNSQNIYFSKGDNQFVTENQSIDWTKISASVNGYGLGDFNGDGGVDFITSSAYFNPPNLCAFHPKENRHLLSSIKNGRGELMKINYKSLTDPSVGSSGYNAYPFMSKIIPLKVVSSIDADNGISTTANSTYYFYSSLKFNLHGKGIMGFDKVTSFNGTTGMREEKYFGLNTTYAYPYLSSIYTYYTPTPQSNTLLKRVLNTYDVFAYENKRILPYQLTSQENNVLTGEVTKITNNYVFSEVVAGGFHIGGKTYSSYTGKPFSIKTEKGLGLETTIQSFTYPNYGPFNGSFTPSKPTFIYSRPSVITTTNTRIGEPAYIRKSNYTYNNVTGQLYTLIADPSTVNEVTTYFRYDDYGNLVRKLTKSPNLPDQDDRMLYDVRHRYVTESYDQAFPEIKTKATYDPISGSKLTETDPDGFETTYTYDAFGRVKTTSDNNGLTSSTNYVWGAQPSDFILDLRGVYYITTTTNTGSSAYRLFDRLGREIKSKAKNFQNKWVGTLMKYNVSGQMYSTTKPYSTSASPVGQNIVNKYDAYGRVEKIETPEGNTTFEYAKTINQYNTKQTNSAGQQSTVGTDFSGRKVEVIDATNNALSYVYNSQGQVRTVTGLGNILQSYDYDNFGRLSSSTDPNYGTYTYTYNSYGQTLSKKDPKNNTYNFEYDALGRMNKKTGPDGTYTYTFDNTAGLNCGKLTQLTGPHGAFGYQYGMGNQLQSSYYYDQNEAADITGNPDFAFTNSGTSLTYDSYGRLNWKQYPSGATVEYAYSLKNGDLKSISNSNSGAILYSKESENDMGQVTSYSQDLGWGNPPLITTLGYDNHNLLNDQRTIVSGTSNTPRHYQYQFETTTGNLLNRKDVKYGLEENFTYDNLNRLVDITFPVPMNLPNIHIGIEPNGNISQKTDAGNFTYDQANRVSEIQNFANIPTLTQDLQYTTFDKVSSITEGGREASFVYNPLQQRSSMLSFNNGQFERYKIYGDDYERELDVVKGDRTWTYIRGPQGNIVAIIANENGVPQDYAVLTDHLGSLTHIIDHNGTTVEEKSFDAWGRLRNPQNWQPYASNLDAGQPAYLFDRGYTGHEHLGEYGIINMNGRLYDPVMGRMFSPDPYIMGSDNLQGYNRYTYALNNPLSYTDPNGEWVNFVIGAVLGGFSGWQIGKANGAKGLDLAGYVIGGAFLGLASSGVSAGISGSFITSSAIANTAIAGTSAGLVGGFNHSLFAGGQPLDGAWKGAISGGTGSLAGSYFGGGWGAFTAGGVSGGLNAAFDKGNIGDIASAALFGGVSSLGLYHGSMALEYAGSSIRKGLSYRSFARMSTDAQRSAIRGKERGGIITPEGGYYDVPAGGRFKDKIDFDYGNGSYDEGHAIAASYHVHWSASHEAFPSDVDWKMNGINLKLFNGFMLNRVENLYRYGSYGGHQGNEFIYNHNLQVHLPFFFPFF